MTETSDVVTPTLKALNSLPFCVAERLHAGRRGRMRFANAGAPDIVATICGVSVYFECKSRDGKVREAQRKWHERARRAGAFVQVIRSPADAVDLARKLFRTGGYELAETGSG